MASNSASEIVDAVGGPGNIASLTHCATRLRFQLNDGDKADKTAVEAIPGVLGAVPQAGDRFQVVIGGGVQTVYNEIMALPVMAGGGAPASAESDADIKARERAKGPRGTNAWLDTLFEFLSDSFRPILGALLGASLFITFMALAATLGWIPAWNAPGVVLPPSWAFVNLMWQCVFIFLPLMVAYNASQKIGADPWVGFAIMAVVMLPGFTALGKTEDAVQTTFLGSDITTVQVFGMPLTIFDYSSQVFPPLLMAAVLGLVYKGLKKVIPENIQLIFVPFIAMLVMIPLTAFLIGPIGVYAGAALANALSAINSFSPFIFAIVIPLAYPFMVPLGLHWPINAIMLLNIQTLGYDFIQGPMGAWNFACFGATAGVLVLAWREKDKQMRQTATGALAAGLLGGISEPSLYGIHLRYKRIYPRMLVGCLTGGLIIGIGSLLLGLPHGITTQAFVFTSLLTIPAFNPIGLYLIAVAGAFVVAMVLVMISGYKNPEPADAAVATAPAGVGAVAPGAARDSIPAVAGGAELVGVAGETAAAATATAVAGRPAAVGELVQVAAPLDGTVVALDQVPDPVFAGGVMGPGVAIEPTGDTVYAPGAGTVVAAQPTGHAFGLQLDNGTEVLIHVGIDTVNLKGEGFDVKVKNGDRVETGTPLVTFDRAVIEKAGYPLITPVIVLNGDSFDTVDPVALGPVTHGSPLLDVQKKA
ncbi:PTS glucose transporter subunit IIA [Microbacterium hominis]|uniref:glucose PTS transporter subunit IIA n=1 Tax=Microbacterium TaxID=33882 RepID=UPI00168B5231|nr:MULTISPECIES: glucose PTS transporter subunit IIA [Microbacterium]QOC24436.1 PTS glucose transporter subunit IIA [Microbacterium hominis]QOC28514.1 PTS glucose transporter subunit IIA [Microbacterium hominis]QYF96284.1 glucose PTS transporter subunit IIA [Microbacterium sp. PAMC21962]